MPRGVASWALTGIAIFALFILAMTKSVRATEISVTYSDGQSLPWPCAAIRWFAATHSQAELEWKARDARLTREQIRQARSCLGMK